MFDNKMSDERTLVLIKPDAMAKCLAGNIISDLYNLDLKIIGLKLIKVEKELAEKHYAEHNEKPFFERLVKHLTGELHNDEKVIAIIYEGKNAVQKIRDAVGKTNPEEADSKTIRGKYGRIHTATECFENAVHASDSPESAKKEIALWFRKEELVE